MDRRWLCHSFKIYCTCYTFNSSAEKIKPTPIFIHSLGSLQGASWTPYSLTPSQIFPFFLKTNILIKCILLIIQPINQNRSWVGMFNCPPHCPGHPWQVQSEQEELFHSFGPHDPACGGRKGGGCTDLALGWKLDVPDANNWTQELKKDLQCHALGTALVTLGTFGRDWAFWGLSHSENRTSGCFCEF